MKNLVFILALLFALPAHAGSVLDFAMALQGPGQYSITGFVVNKYACPPCPEGAQCKPCDQDFVILSDNRCELKKCSSMLKINTDTPTATAAKIGEKITLTVKVDIKTP